MLNLIVRLCLWIARDEINAQYSRWNEEDLKHLGFIKWHYERELRWQTQASRTWRKKYRAMNKKKGRAKEQWL